MMITIHAQLFGMEHQELRHECMVTGGNRTHLVYMIYCKCCSSDDHHVDDRDDDEDDDSDDE